MSYVTLEYNGTEKALADWGIAQQGAIGERVNLRPDTFRCSIPVASINDAPIFPFEALVIVRSNRASGSGAPGIFSGGVVDFVGYRLDPVHDGRPEFEGVYYTFANAWYLLENTPFQQPSANWVVSEGALGFQFTTGLVLFSKRSEGNATDPREVIDQLPNFIIAIDSGWQIEQILKHALAMYVAQSIAAPFQIGTIDVDINLPMYPSQEVMCSAGIQKALELSPDATVRFSYITSPPTISVSATKTPVTLAIANGVDHKSLRISPKPTLQPSVVIIYFRITGTVTIDGEDTTYIQFARQKWGPGGLNTGPEGGLRALIQTIDLAGTSSNILRSSIVCPPVAIGNVLHTDAGQPAVRAWWATQMPKLTFLRYRKVRFDETTIYSSDNPGEILAYGITGVSFPSIAAFIASWPRWVRDGDLQTWMELAGGAPVVGKRVVIKAKCYYTLYASAGSSETDETGEMLSDGEQMTEITTDVTLTNGTTGTYSTVTGVTTGEEIPEGLAQQVWASLAALQYEGDHVKVEQEVSSAVTLENSLNLSGGHADWASMGATIQAVTKDYGNGETSVSFGPATHLNSGDLAALFQFNRQRRWGQALNVRETGKP